MNNETITCTACSKETHWLEVFPNNLCLSCYEVTQQNTTMDEFFNTIMTAFSGKGNK